jgi:cytochrome c-type biogenesis protein CcmH/NrfG
VQLSRQGLHEQAAEHYRRAYELMPTSFGRVESHCFGCESVFDGPEPQSIAEQVFQKLVARDPRNPQVHYLQGYLFEEQGRYADALPAFRTAVQIDGDYLNAWRHLNQVGTAYPSELSRPGCGHY